MHLSESQVAEMYALLREYWQFRHSEQCQPWFPHEQDDKECQVPEPDILKNGPDAPYRY